MPTIPPRYVTWVSACAVFCALALLTASFGDKMFADSDPFWHIATGDWIRAHGAIPASDPFSFTAGDYTWVNMAWAWDVCFSYIHQQLGWHGALAVNALVIALTMALVFATSLLYCGDGIAAFLSTAIALTMISTNLRPLQVSGLMVALWMHVLSGVTRQIYARKWLALLPLSMVLWVNLHGGFFIGLVLLSAFATQALWQRRYRLVAALAACSLASGAACLVNPYGLAVLPAVGKVLFVYNWGNIGEFKPFATSFASMFDYFYLVLFIVLIPRRPLPVMAAERWLSYGWLLLGLTHIRNLALFTIVSAPVFSCFLHTCLKRKQPLDAPTRQRQAKAMAFLFNKRMAFASPLFALAIIVWLPSTSAARLYGQETFSYPKLDEEIAFIEHTLPHARLLTDANLGGFLLYEAHGNIPVFMDARFDQAFPPSAIKDSNAVAGAAPGWEEVLAKYHIDGLMVANDNHPAIDRFAHRLGWKTAFKGAHATIFLREEK